MADASGQRSCIFISPHPPPPSSSYSSSSSSSPDPPSPPPRFFLLRLLRLIFFLFVSRDEYFPPWLEARVVVKWFSFKDGKFLLHFPYSYYFSYLVSFVAPSFYIIHPSINHSYIYPSNSDSSRSFSFSPLIFLNVLISFLPYLNLFSFLSFGALSLFDLFGIPFSLSHHSCIPLLFSPHFPMVFPSSSSFVFVVVFV